MITGMRAPGSSFAGYKLTLGVFIHSFPPCLFQAPGLCTLQMLPHWILAAVLQSGYSSYPCFINEETEAWTGKGSKVTEFSRKRWDWDLKPGPNCL